MNDVSVIEVGHEAEAECREEEGGQLLIVGAPLVGVEVAPHQVIDLERQQEGGVRRRQVHQEALFMDSCGASAV